MALFRCASGSGGGGGGSLKALIPSMTADTTPSGKVTYSVNSSYPAYQAFKRTIQSGWWIAGSAYANNWIKYEFDSPVIAQMAMWMIAGNSDVGSQTITIEASNDDTNYVPLVSSEQVTYCFNYIELNNSTAYKYYKFTVNSSTVNTGTTGVNIQLFGSE